ncbi:hypothetical protein GALMADRAFT_88325 [Galerina marginata CBS 339.88]|uniref:SP-RING-type domain-containing protein n=1 Tax=Galerina marginata (strain CBS 339.88) TaxID=685588 RepID=A0A067TK67_GALM3|nr:hypothetical protein GALMADRAFT_88325 [Galerina marginata CBS 339.88]
MPVATSSRRKPLRRQNSEDIEDVRNTQANGNDDEVSDEDRPRVSRKVKKEKKGKQRPEPEDDDDDVAAAEDEDPDEDDRIDVANFPDQPLQRSDLHKLKGIAEDWRNMQTQIGQRWDIYKDVAGAMAEAGEEDIKTSKDLRELDRAMKEFLDIDAEMTAHAGSLDALYQQIARNEQIVDAATRYEDSLQERQEEYLGKTTRQKYARNPKYIDFHSNIWDVHHPTEPMPPLTDFIDREDGDDDDDDDDLEMGGATQNYDCPITLTLLVNPVTSKVCKHSFSADAIKEHCRNGLAKCPAAGCNKSFRASDCVPDAALAKKVKVYARRMAAAAEDSDAEEVVD